MNIVNLNSLRLEVDISATKNPNSKIHLCADDLLDFRRPLSEIELMLNGLEKELGIDLEKFNLTKNQQVVTLQEDGSIIFSFPYYLVGSCFVTAYKTEKMRSKRKQPIMVRAAHKVNDRLSILIIKGTWDLNFVSESNILTVVFDLHET